MRRRERPQRGQALVLFCLTLLLLALMVFFTLSLGSKIHDKIELQTATDTAAYSNAVATARAFNGVALLNRTHVSLMVAMSGVESLVSWSGLYRGVLNSTQQSYQHIYETYEDEYCPGSRCACARAARDRVRPVIDALKQEQERINGFWKDSDAAAGDQAIALQMINATIRKQAQQKLIEEQLVKAVLKDQNMTRAVLERVKGAYGTDEFVVPNSPVVEKNNQELFGAVRLTNTLMLHHLHATMGARGYSFVTGRSGEGTSLIQARIQQVVSAASDEAQTSIGQVEGSGYFDKALRHAAAGPTGENAWGDDHIAGGESSRFNANNCPHSDSTAHHPGGAPWSTGGLIQAWVRSTDKQDSAEDEEHFWTLQREFSQDDDEAQRERHTLGECIECPGIWPYFVDYVQENLLDPANYHGQPKLYALVERDYTKRPNADPWNLLFKLRFATGGDGADHDNRGLRTAEGLDISRQTAIAAGMVYYHRQGFWQEPPNLMNPFWRATLVHTDGADVASLLGGLAQQSHNQLTAKGFKDQ